MRWVNNIIVIGLSWAIYLVAGSFGDYASYLRAFACVMVGMWSIYDVLSRAA